jgi:diacylglycerol kinase (ATP)
MPKKIDIIINPAAENKEPILSVLNKVFCETDADWHVHVTKAAGEAFSITKSLREQTDLIAVFGGDGTVMEVAQALHGSNTPMAILPGGTANVVAKELQIPLITEEAIRLTTDNYKITEIDMGLVNGTPFLIRVNLGILADMVTEASPEMKETWGQLAYGITAFSIMQQDAKTFRLILDGEEQEQEAVALTVTNVGNIGRKGYAFLPGISITDGLLDVIALDKADFASVLKVTGSMLFQTESTVLKHWKVKEVIIKMEKEETFLCDDVTNSASELRIQVSPKSLKVLTKKDD